MPVISDLSISSVTYDASALTITVDGVAFSELQADAGKVEYSVSGAGSWSEVDSYDSWDDSQIVGSLLVALSAGSYDIRVTNGDNEQATSVAAISVSARANRMTPRVGVGVWA